MADLVVRTDIALRGVAGLLAAAGPRGNVAVARALNRTGAPTSTAAKRIIRKTLGLRQHPYAKRRLGDYLKRTISLRKATSVRLEYSMAGFGKGLPLIFYQPREAPVGASVNWLGARKTINRSFYLSGRFPNRKKSSISHTVWQRFGKSHQSFKEKLRDPYGRANLGQPNGPGVSDAMKTPIVRGTWEAQAAARLPHHLKSALEAVLRGY